MERIRFYDENDQTEIDFEVLDQLTVDGNKYILVADEEEVATILKQVNSLDEEDLTYELVEDDDEFQKLALLFMDNEDYDIEI